VYRKETVKKRGREVGHSFQDGFVWQFWLTGEVCMFGISTGWESQKTCRLDFAALWTVWQSRWEISLLLKWEPEAAKKLVAEKTVAILLGSNK